MLSFLIPAYNCEKYLRPAISSIVTQQNAELEIVIWNDGSTDQTENIAFECAEKYPYIKVFSGANAGASAARNFALTKAIGDRIIFFDADDCLAPGSVEAIERAACTYPDDIVYWPWRKFSGRANSHAMGQGLLAEDMAGWLWLRRAWSLSYPTYNGTFMIPKRLLDRAGGWNEYLSFQDDMEFYTRVISQAGMMRFCSEALFLYRDDVPSSLSHSYGRSHSESHLSATKLAVQWLLNADSTRAGRRAAAHQFMLVSYAQYLSAPDISRQAEQCAKQLQTSTLVWLPGGVARRFLQIVLGWKMALALHTAIRNMIAMRRKKRVLRGKQT